VSSHDGDGVSFLPESVQFLGTVAEPNPEHLPFLHYNGKFGTDVGMMIFHRPWFWPGGSDPYKIDPMRFIDRDPYRQNGLLPWPPLHEYVGAPVTVYADFRAGVSFDGSLAAPFPDPITANSFVPRGGIISVAAGTYPGQAVISRACTLIARDGPVIIGK
jgi:hypothetical protein